MKIPSKQIALIFLVHSDLLYDILRQVSGKTIEVNFSPFDFRTGGEAIKTNFSPFEIQGGSEVLPAEISSIKNVQWW